MSSEFQFSAPLRNLKFSLRESHCLGTRIATATSKDERRNSFKLLLNSSAGFPPKKKSINYQMHAAIHGLHAGATGSDEEDERYVRTQQV